MTPVSGAPTGSPPQSEEISLMSTVSEKAEEIRQRARSGSPSPWGWRATKDIAALLERIEELEEAPKTLCDQPETR
jgi:hypothetical protein